MNGSGDGKTPGRRVAFGRRVLGVLGHLGSAVRRGGQLSVHGVCRIGRAVGGGMTVVFHLVTGRGLDTRRLRRTEEGGVADEAAMIAIVLAAAVLIGGIVFALVEGAGEDLELEIPVGGGGDGDE